jgi:hypothetical protein
MMTDRERIERYVRRNFELAMDWPTVRQVARGLKLSQRVVLEEAEEQPLMLTAYFTEPPQRPSEHFVEICE